MEHPIIKVSIRGSSYCSPTRVVSTHTRTWDITKAKITGMRPKIRRR